MGRLQQTCFQLAKTAGCVQPLRPAEHLLQRKDVGRSPGHTVCTRLFELQSAAFIGMCDGEHGAQRVQAAVQQGAGSPLGAFATVEQVVGVVHQLECI